MTTKPHAYTWLIWSITQGTATIALWYGGGGWGSLSLIFSTLLVMGVFFFSLRKGSRDITFFDTILLGIALLAILVWWQLKNPVLAVIMVSGIDLVGYIPSYRKSFYDPDSETLSSWFGFTVANMFSIAALNEYNFLTLSYIVAISMANLVMIGICLLRRGAIKTVSDDQAP
ncbi:MAG: hypothetical protein HY453_01715 [Parcubacteria group bacterium]|nr:hypothetical protein [Parcubacteria group bacterium]